MVCGSQWFLCVGDQKRKKRTQTKTKIKASEKAKITTVLLGDNSIKKKKPAV